MCYLLEISLFPHLPLLHTYSAGRIQLSSSTHSFLLASESSRPEEWQPTGGIDVKGKGRMLTFLYVDQEEGEAEDKGEGTAEGKEEELGRLEARLLPFIREEALSSAELDEPALARRDTPPVPIPLDQRCSPQLQRQPSLTSSALSKLMLINSTYQRLCLASASSGGGGNSMRGRSRADSPQDSRSNSMGQVEGLALGNGSVSAIDFQSAGGSGCFLAEDLLVAASRAPNTPVTTTTGPDLDLRPALLCTPQQAGLARSAPDATGRPLIAAAVAAAAALRSGFGTAPSPGTLQQRPIPQPPGGIIRAPPASTITGTDTLLQLPGGSSDSTSSLTRARSSLSRMSGNSALPSPTPADSGLQSTLPLQLPAQQQLTFPGFGRLSSAATTIDTAAGGLQKRVQERSVLFPSGFSRDASYAAVDMESAVTGHPSLLGHTPSGPLAMFTMAHRQSLSALRHLRAQCVRTFPPTRA